MFSRPLDLPLDKDASSRFLPWIVALMVYLATLALAVIMGLSGLTERWDKDLAGALTVQVMPIIEPGEGPEKQRARLEKNVVVTLEILDETPGVVSAEALGEEEVAALLEPWLGAGSLSEDLDLPILIGVVTNPARPVDIAGLESRLHAKLEGVSVDDHKFWFDRLSRLAQLVEFIAVAIVLCIGFSAMATVIFTTKSGMAVHHDVIEILHLIGARDSYIARQFQYHALVQGLRGALGGFALAVSTIFIVALMAARIDAPLLPDFSLNPLQWGILFLFPLFAILLTTLTARLVVSRALGRML